MENKSSTVLRRRSEFTDLQISGKRHWASNWLLLNYKINSLGQIRFGVTASRKVGSAVIRNKLKRWCRDFFRESLKCGNSLSADINVIFKPMEGGFYKDLSYEEFIKVLEVGIQVVRKNL